MNAPAQADATGRCANCSAPAAGAYCHACGQRIAVHRLTLPHLLHEIPHAIFHVDRGLLVTIRELALHPGRTIRDYLDGRRIRYFNPLSLLAILAGLCALCYAKFPFDFSGFVIGAPAKEAEIMIRIQKTMLVNYSIGLAMQLPLLALATYWVLRCGRSYGEHLVVNAFILAFLCAINLAMMPAFMVANGSHWMPRIMMTSVVFYLIYQLYALWDTFRTPGRGVVGALRTIAALAVFYAMIVIGAMIVGVIIGAVMALRGQ
ncbi:MAG: DUF3667 domain-containing protein [Pseudomonadota bacterium]